MRYSFPFLLPLALVLGLRACSSNGSSGCADPSSKEPGTTPEKEEKGVHRRRVEPPLQHRQPLALHRDRARDHNTSSGLVVYSELARTMHGSGHALLVPRDETFKENKDGNPHRRGTARGPQRFVRRPHHRRPEAPNPWKGSMRTSTERRSSSNGQRHGRDGLWRSPPAGPGSRDRLRFGGARRGHGGSHRLELRRFLP